MGPEFKAAYARWLGIKILGYTGLSPSQIEVFPKQTSLTSVTPYGNFVKLPLGYHQKKRKWSYFLNHETFKPLPNTVMLGAYGASFFETDLKALDDLSSKEIGVQMRLPIRPLLGDFRTLEDREEKETAEILAKYWRKGYRNRLEMAFLGWCLKNGVSYESA